MLIVTLAAPLGVLCSYLAFLCLYRRQRKLGAVLALFAILFLSATLVAGGVMIFAREYLQQDQLSFVHSLDESHPETAPRQAPR